MIKGLVPVPEGWLSQKYSSSHKAIDIGWIDKAYCDVRAWNDGEVIANSKDDAGANFVVLRHENGQWSGYWHLRDKALPAVGAYVKRGEKIGVRGKTGKASGVHLHFILTSPLVRTTYNYTALISSGIDPVPWLYRLPEDKIEDMQIPVYEDPDAVTLDEVTEGVQAMVTALYDSIGYTVTRCEIETERKK